MDEVVWKILSTVAKRGFLGATREDLFREARGIGYAEVEQILLDLEGEGHLTIEWLGFNKFIATITPGGAAIARAEFLRRIDEIRQRAAQQTVASESGDEAAAKGN